MTGIEWKVIPQTCGLYEVSNFGDVRESGSGKILNVSQNSKGYAIVSLPKIKKLIKVHKYVALMFVKMPTGTGNRLDALQVDHIDGIRMNNDYRNLRWVTASENNRNQFGRKTKYNRIRNKVIRRTELESGSVKLFYTLTDAARKTGLGISTVKERLQTGRPTKSGYMFEYITKEETVNGRK